MAWDRLPGDGKHEFKRISAVAEKAGLHVRDAQAGQRSPHGSVGKPGFAAADARFAAGTGA